MPHKNESMSAKEAPEKKPERSKPSKQEQAPKTPEDKKALELLRNTYSVMDEYEKLRTEYELALLDQKKQGPPTKEQKKLKSELQSMWDQLKSLEGELAENEYFTQNEDLQKGLEHARQNISELHGFTGQEATPAEKSALESSTDVKVASREAVKIRTREKLRNQDSIKKMRSKLARLKSSFAGAYKISTSRADILLSQPTGFLGALKGLYDGSMPTADERQKLKALRSEDAQELLDNIHNLEAEIDKAWKQAKKQEAIQDIENEETIMEANLDDTVSIPTLREHFMQEINEAKRNKNFDKAKELEADLNHAYDNLREHFPELVRIKEEDSDHPERATILPPEVNAQVTARDYVHEPKVIIPEQKQAREAPTLRSRKEEQERQDKIQSSIEAFGGGEAGRKYAADLWDYANSQIKEQGGIMLQGEKGKFKDALEYVNAFAEKVAKSTEVLGRERSAQIWQEINDHRNHLLQSESLTAKEKQQLQELDPVYYVEQSALRDQALQEDDLNAAGKHNAIIDEINSLLGYPEGMNPSTGEGMGRAPQKETRALGKRTAALEAASYAERSTGAKARTAEAGQARELKSEQTYSLEWADRMLNDAKQEWSETNKLIEADPKTGKKIINTELLRLFARVSKLEAGQNLSDEFRNLRTIDSITAGEPAEVTKLVMLKAADKLNPLSEADKKIKAEIIKSLSTIESKLKNLNKDLPRFELTESDDFIEQTDNATAKNIEEKKDLPRFELPDEAPEIEVRPATDNETYIVEASLEAEKLDKLTEAEINQTAEIIKKSFDKRKNPPKDIENKLKNELRKYYSALYDGNTRSASASKNRLLKSVSNLMTSKKYNELQSLLEETRKELLAA